MGKVSKHMQIGTTEHDLINKTIEILKRIRTGYDAGVKEAPRSVDEWKQDDKRGDENETDRIKVQRMDTYGGMDSQDFNIDGNYDFHSLWEESMEKTECRAFQFMDYNKLSTPKNT